MGRLFDMIVMVDWSAAAKPTPPKPSADAVWMAAARGGEVGEPEYFRTRAACLDRLATLLRAEIAAGRRVLAGFDFPFGWPRGLARAVTGDDAALGLWAWLADAVEDAPDNSNNRFAVAERLNAQLPGVGPFWGRPATADHPGVPEKGRARDGHGLPERRLVEAVVKGAQPCWKLYTTGSVGSQALLGVAALERLRRREALAGHVQVWPFETGLVPPSAPVCFAEIYPSLLRPEVKEGEVKDAAQVRAVAGAYAALDAAGALGARFAAGPGLSDEERAVVAREEAWILGAGASFAPPGPRALKDDCFALPPGVDWEPVDAALARLRARVACVCEAEDLALAQADGRILAEPALAIRAHPPEPNAAVDGYAFAHAAMGAGALPLLAGRAAAGAPFSGVVPPGAALRILTGATLPAGTDTVVMDEDATAEGGVLRFEPRLKPGANRRRAGENLTAGAVAAPAGRRLTPADLAQIAAGGLGAVRARRRLRVAVLSTGDEIAAPGAAPPPGAVFDSNRPMLLAMLARMGFEPVDLGVAPDDAAAVRAALDRGAAGADAIIASGGASAGDEDHMSRALREAGTLGSWRIAMKPGRPLALGMWRGAPVFGLPGNPVAAFVCALLFARPALAVMAGADWPEPRPLMLPAAFAKRKKAGRREFLRARLTEAGAVEAFHSEGSGLIGGLSWAEGLAELPDGALDLKPGDPVAFHGFPSLGL